MEGGGGASRLGLPFGGWGDRGLKPIWPTDHAWTLDELVGLLGVNH